MHTLMVSNEKYQKCIDKCLECAKACEYCATACLDEPNPQNMARCIKLDRDCADICLLSAQYMARDSDFSSKLCNLCAEICNTCGDECSKFPTDHCQQCADICHECATECKNMTMM